MKLYYQNNKMMFKVQILITVDTTIRSYQRLHNTKRIYKKKQGENSEKKEMDVN